MSRSLDELRRLAGSLLLAGFEGHEAPAPLLDRIAAREVGGVILFSRNLQSPAQVATLTDRLARAVPEGAPLLLSVDQEGGRVQRIKAPFAHYPSARQTASKGDLQLTREVGRAIGQDLRLLGFNLDFAPVLDVVANDENQVIGDRSFGSDPEAVARHGLSFARGLRESEILPCGKHFPGHGGPVSDSHTSLPRDLRSREELWRSDLVPFSAAAERQIPMLMTAHVVYPAFDEDAPATLSRTLCTDLLRGELHFAGVLISDDMEMEAVSQRYGAGEAALRAVRAGVDLVLICKSEARQAEALDALARAAGASAQDQDRIEEAASRVNRLRGTLPAHSEEDPVVRATRAAARNREELLERLR